ncbi:alpha/beta fold hydrolase [Streptomyces sp. NPDC057717]|uniref:alpha/beta fold hydrolase n=1 Tax=Streptomyces sp. NPDC057717 TaxID=3346224 RepID=UPI00367B2468
MPLVLVHGVPETAVIWEPLRRHLGRGDVIALSPPGFGAPVPEGFGATADEYHGWLIGELEQMEEPIDLVGHDWGGLHVQRVAATRPDLIRSWCSDVVGGTDPAYIWHDLAQAWQTPGVGESTIEQTFGAPIEDQIATFVEFGMTAENAKLSVEACGPEMGASILKLYRSALQPAPVEWGNQLARAERRPALVINATEDVFVGGPEFAHRAAVRFGAREAVLDGLGHWWMLQDPKRGAAALNDFHASLATG